MLTANDILDVFMLPIGFFVQNRIFDILLQTGLIWVPYMIVLMMIIVEVRMNGMKGEQAIEMILSQAEIKCLSMSVVLALAVVPYTVGGPSTPDSIQYTASSCNDKYRRVLVGQNVPEVRESFTFTHNIESYSNVIYGITNLFSTATVNAVTATLPCTIGYKDFEYIKANTFIQDPKTQGLVESFAKQCYIPALQNVLGDSDLSFDASIDSYIEEFGVLSAKIMGQYAKQDPPLIMTTNKEDWKDPPFDNITANDTISTTCYTALEPIGRLILADPQVSKSLTVTAKFTGGGFTDTLLSIGTPDVKYSLKDADNMQTTVIQQLFAQIVGPSAANKETGYEGGPGSEWTLWNILEWSLPKLFALVGSVIAWLIATGTAQIAVDIIPWMIAIFQGTVAAFSILVIFFNCYSGRSVMIVVGTVVALEFSLLALEFAIWIDNVVFTILHSRLTVANGTIMTNPHAPFLAGYVSLLVYLSLPMFAYRWISSNIGAGQGVGDMTGGAERIGAIGVAGTAKLLGNVGKLLSAGGGALGNANKAGEELRNQLNPKA
ncbi:conjugal transfer protein TraG N-terminal domain-containing protein [Vibrio tubiashii]|uniref:conjugal transfer protein TraG N-terminal domain-containing protein n=1 Tax=Vibrio tubiashii TaxID=29498 RepID=UPI001EFD63DF|nr:conjugal transfer protein TraG N-terminal domain-containing protein [Vibrio tubiashii]MCG9576697.1 conjugal transfer protein TraG N-terminal domain-containing protein [Vibrio tubiashii]